MTYRCIDSRPRLSKTGRKVWGSREGCPSHFSVRGLSVALGFGSDAPTCIEGGE